jgi:gliding motility-associated-like protein
VDDFGRVTVYPVDFVRGTPVTDLTFRFYIGGDRTSLSFTCNDIGFQTASIVAIDGKGNRSQPKEVTFTVSDRTPPDALCKSVTLHLIGDRRATLTAIMIDNGSTDNCGIVSRHIKRTLDGDDLYVNSLDFGYNDLNSSVGDSISVSFRVRDASGNEAICISTIRLEQIFPSNLGDIPDIFTPNGDGFNDTWEIPGIDQYPEATIRIYNRAKKLAVELKGAQMPWDGRDLNGNLLESGYYLYLIELRKGGKIISGYVTILR